MEFKSDLRKAKDNFKRLLFEADYDDPIVCSIHDVFHDPESDEHNCIGCNLAVSISSIDSYFKRIESYDELEEAYNDLIIKLYLFVERANELFRIMEVPEEDRAREFKCFQLINKWANFIKHPKAFMFCHAPEYAVNNIETSFDLIVDCAFVKKYYSGKKKNLGLYEILENNPSVIVLFPSAESLIIDFAEEVIKIEPLISNNQDYRNILHQKATLEAYFEVEDRS